MSKSSASSGGTWVTINGVHILIGASGKIEKGPAKFIGSTVADMKNSSKSPIDKDLRKKIQSASKPKNQSGKSENSNASNSEGKTNKSASKQESKYPSGITTTAQKRAYTRAINSGKTTSEATKIAKGKSHSEVRSEAKKQRESANMEWKKPFAFTETYRSGDYTISKDPSPYGGYVLQKLTPNPNFSYHHSDISLGKFRSLDDAKKAAVAHKNKNKK